MKGDFSKLTFDAAKHFTRVMQQQGRVQLDADWNEQTAILLHYMQQLASDLIGDHGGPKDDIDNKIIKRKKLGFDVIDEAKKLDEFSESALSETEKEGLLKKLATPETYGPFLIGKGRYYVEGRLAEVDDYYGFYEQPDYPWEKNKQLAKGQHLIYLDLWERHITSFEDASIREVALEGADTASRAKLVWQVKAVKISDTVSDAASLDKELDIVGEEILPKNRGKLKVQAKADSAVNEPCTIAPQSSYRGLENQLYRVEIYKDGDIFKYKWSRDNASIVTGASIVGELLTVNDARGFSTDQWVEITSDKLELLNESGKLFKIKSIQDNNLTLEFNKKDEDVDWDIPSGKIKARRWDGAETEIKESKWFALADGVSIEFQPADTEDSIHYRDGDYWLIPVRTATANAEWPKDTAKPPFGVDHYYAPLAVVEVATDQTSVVKFDLRKVFTELTVPITKLKK